MRKNHYIAELLTLGIGVAVLACYLYGVTNPLGYVLVTVPILIIALGHIVRNDIQRLIHLPRQDVSTAHSSKYQAKIEELHWATRWLCGFTVLSKRLRQAKSNQTSNQTGQTSNQTGQASLVSDAECPTDAPEKL